MIEIPLIAIISGVLTIGVRMTGLMLFAPFFGSMVIPARIKAGLVLALTLALYPGVWRPEIGPHTLIEWPMLVFNEFLVGVGMGIATNVVFEAIQLTGSVLGIQMGYSLVNILDPQSQVDTPVVAMFYQSIAMLRFSAMNCTCGCCVRWATVFAMFHREQRTSVATWSLRATRRRHFRSDRQQCEAKKRWHPKW